MCRDVPARPTKLPMQNMQACRLLPVHTQNSGQVFDNAVMGNVQGLLQRAEQCLFIRGKLCQHETPNWSKKKKKKLQLSI